MIHGLRRLTDAVHDEGGKIVFQLAHAGRQTRKSLIGRTPLAPTGKGRDPAYFVKPVAMTQAQIEEAIEAFGQAAWRAVEAGADGVQIHAAHGYLINQFLSPYWNQRDDAWGGSDENRFRFLKEVVLETRKALPAGMPLLVKLNTHDHTPRDGVVPPLAVTYAKWLAGLGIDGLELSCGSTYYCFAEMCRGEIPVDGITEAYPLWMRPMVKLSLRQMEGKFDLEEGYNVPAAELIRPEVGNLPLLVVGGLRRLSHMEDLLDGGTADLISMARPFIREPALARRFRQGTADASTCTSCNKCFALVSADRPVRCTEKGTGT
jgi:2,4-dienoyl-CoA reductase-like NADH-dependent reductase (Old Yellow Enzyme family)